MKQARKFTSMVGHEMRTPLYYIIFFAQRIQTFLQRLEGKKAEGAKRQIELVRCALHHLSSFVDDLLDFQQIQDGVFALVQTSFNPTECLDMVCNLFAPKAEGKQIKIDWTTDRHH